MTEPAKPQDNAISSRCYLPWPDDDKPIRFELLANEICKAIRFAYKIKRQNEDQDIPWRGPNIGPSDRVTCLSPHEQLSAEMLAWSKDDQGRDALDEIVGLALRLGIEQGRRIFKESHEYKMMQLDIRRGR